MTEISSVKPLHGPSVTLLGLFQTQVSSGKHNTTINLMFAGTFWKGYVYRLLQIIFAHPPQETNQILKKYIPFLKNHRYDLVTVKVLK